MNSELEFAKNYFEQKKVLKQILEELVKKYYTYGKFTGTIKKSELLDYEPLLGFIGVDDVQWNKTARFKLDDFVEAYYKSKFAKVDLNELIVVITGQKLVTKEEVADKVLTDWKQYLDSIHKKAPHIFKSFSDVQIKHYFNQSVKVDVFEKVNYVIDNMPTKLTRLPVFSYQVLNDPHGLDRDNNIGRMFWDYLKTTSKADDNEIYLSVNLIKDDILNFVTVQNLIADNSLFKAASADNIIWNVPLMQLLKIESVKPSSGNKVFIIENSSVYAIVTDSLKQVPLIMSSGQFKMATWKILDLLPKDIEIYYSSDMDPAGLVMSQKLWERYGNRVHFIGMSTELYRKYQNSGKKLLDVQISVLKGITLPVLNDLKMLMLNEKKAVYQEAEISEIISGIKAVE